MILDALKPGDCRAVFLNNPTLSRQEFIEYLAIHFDLSAAAVISKARFLTELQASVAERHAAGGLSTLVVDEAQSMPDELLEEVRLIANLETNTEKLLPVVLAGQPELSQRLNRPNMRQLKQRVALRCELKPFDMAGTAAYTGARIHVAGGDVSKIFTRRALELIYAASQGIPRTISVICDNALISAFAANVRPVGGQIIEEVCRDFDLEEAPDAAAELHVPSVQRGSVFNLQAGPVAAGQTGMQERGRRSFLDLLRSPSSLPSRRVLK
jgi:general secretion pathway protein A